MHRSPATVPTAARGPLRQGSGLRSLAVALALGALVVVAAACSSKNSPSSELRGTLAPSTSSHASSGPTTSAVRIALTSGGCAPTPSRAPAGPIEVRVTNKNASSVSEAELRSLDRSHVLGGREHLSPGLSERFSLTLAPGSYVIDCPGPARAHWSLTVTGHARGGSKT